MPVLSTHTAMQSHRVRPVSLAGRLLAAAAVIALAVSGITTTTTPVAASTGTNVITGTVVDESDPAGTAVEGVVGLYEPGFGVRESVFLNSATPPSSFAFTSVPDGEYLLFFRADDSGYVVEWWEDALALESATPITVSGGQAQNVQASVAQGGVISGIATVGGVDRSVIAEAHSLETGQVYSSWSTSMPGGYEIRALPPGTYVVQFRTYDSRYIAEWWNGVPSRDLAEVITIVGAETVPNIDADLDRAAIVSGTVVDESGLPIPNAFVLAVAADDPSTSSFLDSDRTDTQGRFDLDSLPGGDVLIRVSSTGNHIPEWYDNAATEYTATRVPAVLNQQTLIGEIELATGGIVAGRVTSTRSGAPMQNVVVRVSAVNEIYHAVENLSRTDGSGNYAVNGLPTGRYLIQVVAESNQLGGPFDPAWYGQASWRHTATPVDVDAGFTVTGLDVALSPVRQRLPERLAGADRYSAAAAMSASFRSGVDVVYVATGRNFPDALGAAAAAARLKGPLLLVEPNSIPAAVAAELERLDPRLIVLVGGTASVSSAVQSELEQYAGVDGVRRDDGPDRYAASRTIAERAFTEFQPSRVLIATGATFPDALAGASWAGGMGLPVLLVAGSAPGLDAATRQTFDTLGVRSATIAGGPASVSQGIEAELRELFGNDRVDRISGPDRYAVAAALSRDRFYPGISDTVYLATGLGFPDALAGAALAGNSPAPLLLVPKTCVPQAVFAEIERLDASRIVILGGEATVAPSVRDMVPCGW